MALTTSPAATDQPMTSAEVGKVLGVDLNPLLNSLPSGSADKLVVIDGSHGAYVGEGFPPVPAKVAAKIRQGDFEIGELLSEFWSIPREDDGGTKPDGGRHRSHLVTDIFTWLQCFSMYTSIRASHTPAMLPELMVYMSHIIRVHQDYAGLAWI